MTASRPLPVRVALLGFSAFERQNLTAYFRLAAEREQRYELVTDLTSAELLVADADHAPSVQLVVITERLGETVFIGSQAPPGASGSMRRPIDTLHVVRALDALAHRDHTAQPLEPLPSDHRPADSAPVASPQAGPTRLAPTPTPATAPPTAHTPAPAFAPAPAFTPAPAPAPRAPSLAARAVPPVPARVSGRSSLTALRRATPRPAQPPAGAPSLVGPPPPPIALLVDDSPLALRFLASRLMPWCVRIDTAGSSTEALEMLTRRAYDFVFLDLELGTASELDGLALCRQIKRNALAVSASVVMVSAHHSEIDRARGALAGCDGYLSKPLNETELATLLRRQGLVPPPAPAPTAIAASGT